MEIDLNRELLGVPIEELMKHFDAEFYTAKYSDVAQASVEPLSHYLKFGWREQRSPFPEFDVAYYRNTHMEGDTGTCPLAHYVKFGVPAKLPTRQDRSADEKKAAAVRDWHTTLDERWTDQIFQLLQALGFDTQALTDLPLGRYLRAMFSPDYYRRVKEIGPEVDDNECFVRYIAFGLPAGMAPGAFFDEPTYRRRATENGLPPIGASESAFLHWMRHGLPRDISPSPLFSPRDYAALNKDLDAYPGSLTEHFLLRGIPERRQFSKLLVVAQELDDDRHKTIRRFFDDFRTNATANAELREMKNFRNSGQLRALVASAAVIEPQITTKLDLRGFLPPWHDAPYAGFRRTLDALPDGPFRSVVLMPFCKMGGADYVAGILARTLSGLDGPVLVIQTDQPDDARPDWFEGVDRIDISQILKGLDAQQRTRTLYEVLRRLRPANVFNVNSRLAFDTFVRFGKQLSAFTRLHAYYFCADRTPEGDETGYPVMYFSNIFHHLTTAITDSADLSESLGRRFCLPPEAAGRMRTVYTPATVPPPASPIVEAQVRSAATRKRPVLIWAGRFDRQKRFDLLLNTARALPDVDFLCWGKAVLDPTPDLDGLPGNVTLHEPFTTYAELPLEDVDGFFYTSDWDGLPTILIELGGFGMPIVASGAGGVPELIDDTTGWRVPVGSPASAYEQAISEMLATPDERIARARALRARVQERHGADTYAKCLAAILKGAAT